LARQYGLRVESQVAHPRDKAQRWSGFGVIWPVLAIGVAAYAAHDLGLGGSGADDFFDLWLNDALLWGAAAACLVGALRAARSRTAWLLVALALASWATGDTIWSIRFGDAPDAPLTSISDVFWLAWYPLIVAGLGLLVRDRVPAFELHRWIDGVVVMLILATPWVAVFLEPIASRSPVHGLDEAVDFAYPLGDAVLVGATLGVFALMAWRPGRMWILLGLGFTVVGLADAAYSLDVLGHSYQQSGVFDAAWVGGVVLVAYAAWQPHPGHLEPRKVGGWSAIALPLAAQALAIGIQVYGYFYELARSERILTIVVLLIAMVQIVVTRPRSRRNHRSGGEYLV